MHPKPIGLLVLEVRRIIFLQVLCECKSGWTGENCSQDIDACADNPCYPSVNCTDLPPPSAGYTCGPCPSGMVGNGTDCRGNLSIVLHKT